MSDYDHYLEIGCEDWSHTFGIQEMPEGYALMLTVDQSHFFWIEKATDIESSPHWNRWAAYRGAKAHAARKQEAGG